jgi:hypothetical protein
MTRSLSRGELLPTPNPNAPSIPWEKDHRLAALAFLNSKARWPGVDTAKRLATNEIELDSMSLFERTLLDIEMKQREGTLHSFDYDPLALGRL